MAANVVAAVFLSQGLHDHRRIDDLADGADGRAGWHDGPADRPDQQARRALSIRSPTAGASCFIFIGLLYFYLGQGDRLACLLVFAAAAGSMMVSYTKSRAETLGFDCNVGVLTRMERFLVLGPGLLLNLPWLAVAIIAVLANFTALQRAWYVWGQAKGK